MSITEACCVAFSVYGAILTSVVVARASTATPTRDDRPGAGIGPPDDTDGLRELHPGDQAVQVTASCPPCGGASADDWEATCETACGLATMLLWHCRLTTDPAAVAELVADLGVHNPGGLLARCLAAGPRLPYPPGCEKVPQYLSGMLDGMPPERLALLKASVRGVLAGWSKGRRRPEDANGLQS